MKTANFHAKSAKRSANHSENPLRKQSLFSILLLKSSTRWNDTFLSVISISLLNRTNVEKELSHLALEFNFVIWCFIEKDVSLDIYEAFEEIEKVLFYLEFWNPKALTLLSSSRSWSVWKTAPKLSDIFSRTMRLSNRKEFFKIFGGAENNRHHVSSTVF